MPTANKSMRMAMIVEVFISTPQSNPSSRQPNPPTSPGKQPGLVAETGASLQRETDLLCETAFLEGAQNTFVPSVAVLRKCRDLTFD